jgi:hypothetical protein
MNLEFDGIDDLLGEFLRDPSTWQDDIITFLHNEVTPQIEEHARKGIKDMISRVFSNYSSPGGDNTGVLDLKNQKFDEMYDNNGKPVYNFISGRSVSYLSRVAVAIYHLGLARKVHEKFVDGCVQGLIGLGTNNFTNEKQSEEYRKSIKKLFHKVVKDLGVLSKGSSATKRTLNFTGKTVDEAIHEWILYTETVASKEYDDNVVLLYNYIYKNYNCTVDNMVNLLTKYEEDSNKDPADQKGELRQFINDMSRIDGLAELWNKHSTSASTLDGLKHNLTTIQKGWATYKEQVLESMMGGKAKK